MYVQEAISGITRSHTIDHHQILEGQCISENLRTSAIYHAHKLLAIEKANLQLVNLEGVVVDLQRHGAILVQERENAR